MPEKKNSRSASTLTIHYFFTSPTPGFFHLSFLLDLPFEYFQTIFKFPARSLSLTASRLRTNPRTYNYFTLLLRKPFGFSQVITASVETEHVKTRLQVPGIYQYTLRLSVRPSLTKCLTKC